MKLLCDLLLFAGAVVGHTALVVYAVNYWYGLHLPRKVHSVFREVCGLLVAAWPFFLYWQFGLDLRAAWTIPSDDPGRTLLAAYLAVCWIMGLGVFPGITLYRLLRPCPAALVAHQERTVDVAAELGYRPIGHGKHRLLARLPRNEIFRVDLTEKTLRLPSLPAAWDGLTILHLSDVHFCGTPDREFYQRILDEVRSWEPDLLALTGDINDSKRHHRWIVPLLGRLRWKLAAFAVLGNHDYYYQPDLTRRRLRRLGFRVLGNSWEQLEVRGEPLLVVGHEGPWFTPGPDLAGCPEGIFRLCLSHTPDNMRWARRNQIDLMLAGHNHGGQIRVPGLGSILVPSRTSRRYDCGLFYEPPTLLHVSRGLGGLHPLRYNCRPEVTRLVLRAGA